MDSTIARVRLDRKVTNISLLVVPGVRRDGHKVLPAVRNMGGGSEAAGRSILNGLFGYGLRTPEFLATDSRAGLDRALVVLWPDVPAQCCTVRKTADALDKLPKSVQLVAESRCPRSGRRRTGRRPKLRL